MRILIVAGETATGIALKDMLVAILAGEVESIQIRHALRDSRSYIRDRPVDLAFLDLDGPDAPDGPRGPVGPGIRERPADWPFPAIAFSGRSDRMDEALAAGAVDFVAKPFDQAAIRRALERFRGGVARVGRDDPPPPGRGA